MRRVKTNNQILVPIDFSDTALLALGHAIKLAEVYFNEITLLYIVEEHGMFGMFSKSGGADLIKEAIEGRLAKTKNEIIEKHNITVHTRIEEGKVYKTIAKVANEGNFDSIIMGSNGAGGFERLIGSNASRVIQLSEVPVVVVKEKAIGEGYKKLVLPIDLTMESKQKVGWAAHIAKKFDGVVHVIFENSSDEFTHNRIVANISQVKSMLDAEGVKYVTKELEDKFFESFAEEALTYADAVAADLIIIMTQQEKGFSEFILGSLAQQIVNKSSLPVMCVNPAPTGYSFDGTF